MTVSYPRAARHCRRLTIRELPPSPAPTAPPTVPTGQIAVDDLRRMATAGGRLLALTRLEFDLLAHLVAEPMRVFTRDQLLESVWDLPAVGDGRTVDVLVTRLRRKLGPGFRQTIATVRGVGYKYDPPRS
ncbi:DNA-binding response OmpR family regulator [Streptacidiphilus sp. MAP12-33]|uniref:winged helix-turn-helix domain-containing protein n=1 Tax=Streptacidiphilus sp. MAP12-33 TaxID=3156266 RepID=UPI0035160F0E